VIEAGTYFLFSFEALEEDGIGFHGAVGDFERDLAAVSGVGGAKDGSHSAFSDECFEAVVIELAAWLHILKKAHEDSSFYWCDG
jgi:hypothetical protein